MFSVNKPRWLPATATEDVWWKQPTPSSPASASACRVPSTLTAAVAVRRRGHVVEARDVEDIADRAAGRGDPRLVDPERGVCHVTHDGSDPVAALPTRCHAPQPLQRTCAHQAVDVAGPGGEQLLDQVPADEAGRAGDQDVRPCL
jgi:hypothetical protein